MSAIALDPLIAEAKRRTRRRRNYLAVVLVVAVAVGGAFFRLSTPGGASHWSLPAHGGSSALTRFAGSGLSFRYPANWKRFDCPEEGSQMATYAFLTNAPSGRCPTYSRNASWYQPPVRRLGVDGVLVEWWNVGLEGMGTTLADVPGRKATIGGFPARVETARNGAGVRETNPACKWVGGLAKVVTIQWPAMGDGWLMVTGCFRGPNLSANEAAFSRMLTSLRLAKS